MTRDTLLPRLRTLLLALLPVLVLDQSSKALARTLLQHRQLSCLGGHLRLYLAFNPGLFLGLGSTLPPLARFLLVTMLPSLAVLVALGCILSSRMPPAFALCWSVLAAGVVSNQLDRLFDSGRVTDFVVLSLGHARTGVFNVADLAVDVGAVLLLYRLTRVMGSPCPDCGRRREPSGRRSLRQHLCGGRDCPCGCRIDLYGVARGAGPRLR